MHKIVKTIALAILLISPAALQAKPSRARYVATGSLKLLASIPFAILTGMGAYKLPNINWHVMELQMQETLQGQPLTTIHKISISVMYGGLIAFCGSVGAYLAHRGIKDLKKAFNEEKKPKKKKKKKATKL